MKRGKVVGGKSKSLIMRLCERTQQINTNIIDISPFKALKVSITVCSIENVKPAQYAFLPVAQ